MSHDDHTYNLAQWLGQAAGRLFRLREQAHDANQERDYATALAAESGMAVYEKAYLIMFRRLEGRVPQPFHFYNFPELRPAHNVKVVAP